MQEKKSQVPRWVGVGAGPRVLCLLCAAALTAVLVGTQFTLARRYGEQADVLLSRSKQQRLQAAAPASAAGQPWQARQARQDRAATAMARSAVPGCPGC